MTKTTHGAGRKFLTRALATAALIGVYAFGTIAVSGLMLTSSASSAQAQRGNRGGGGGGGRGGARGGGGGRGGGAVRGGGGRGRGFQRGGIWYPWVSPGICHHPWTSANVVCNLY